jgi:hypothetical protein
MKELNSGKGTMRALLSTGNTSSRLIRGFTIADGTGGGQEVQRELIEKMSVYSAS